jgi:hypothetical protein
MSELDRLREGVKRIKDSEAGKEPPQERNYLDIVRDSTLPGGAIDMATFDSHRTGRSNGGIACDTTRGPCRCGAWH